MTPRERIMAAINHQPLDHLPCDIWATPEVWQMLQDHFGTEDRFEIWECLGIDGIVQCPVQYTGRDRTLPDGTQTGIWGARYRTIELRTGGVYQEQVFYPLKDVTDPKELDDFNWEDPADYDYAAAAESCRQHHDGHCVIGGYIAPFVDLWTLFGQETALLNLVLRPGLIEAALDRTMAYRMDLHRRLFEATGCNMDMCQVTDDFGGQNGLVMNKKTIETIFWPHYREAIRLCKEYNLKVFHHDDGGMYDIIADLCEMGVDVLNPVQWRCQGMDRAKMKAQFGDHLCFHGAVDTQQVMPFGTPEEVREEVRENVRLLASDGTGYIVAPCHNIQSGTPLENVLALYDEIRISGDMSR